MMEYVFPLPVWPYAKMEALKPAQVLAKRSTPIKSNTVFWLMNLHDKLHCRGSRGVVVIKKMFLSPDANGCASRRNRLGVGLWIKEKACPFDTPCPIIL